MSSKLVAVVLAGGSGTRLWPLSRQLFPKQFVKFNGDKSMLGATVARLEPLIARDDVWVVTSGEVAIGAGYQELKSLHHVAEPVARNTAPAVGLMAAYLADFANDPVMLILPADHAIGKVGAFHRAIRLALAEAEKGKLVTFGIRPTRAETGYGYIQAKPGKRAVLPVENFVEKPNAKTAQKYLRAGNYYWNSGMFVARASVMLAEIAQHAKEVAKVLADMRKAWKGGEDFRSVVAGMFPHMPSDSLDYAVLEKSSNVSVVPCSIGWSDVGSWDAVYDLADKDANGNAVKAPAVMIGSRNNLLMGAGRAVAAIGVENLCIVDTPDALLVMHRGSAQRVKEAVEAIKKRGGEEHLLHRTVQRPWGSYTVLEDSGRNYKLKRIEVLPGGRLSLQSHRHRSEHWVVVGGTATVTHGKKVRTLRSGQSTYIPLGTKHRLENLAKTLLHIVEVQVGEYLGEDDITRYADAYDRVDKKALPTGRTIKPAAVKRSRA